MSSVACLHQPGHDGNTRPVRYCLHRGTSPPIDMVPMELIRRDAECMAQLIFQPWQFALRHEHQHSSFKSNMLSAGEDREFRFTNDSCDGLLDTHVLGGQRVSSKGFRPDEDGTALVKNEARQAAIQHSDPGQIAIQASGSPAALSQRSKSRKLATVTSCGRSPAASQAPPYSARIDS